MKNYLKSNRNHTAKYTHYNGWNQQSDEVEINL